MRVFLLRLIAPLIATVLVAPKLCAISEIYWSESPLSGARIRKTSLSPTGIQVLSTVPADQSRSVARFRRNGDHLYWCETFFPAPKIFRANLDGSGVTAIATTTGTPADMVVGNGSIYWSESGSPNRIMKAGLDGQNPMQVVAAPFLGFDAPPRALAVTSEYLYWSAYQSSSEEARLFRASIANPSEIVELSNTVKAADLLITDSFIYAADASERSNIVRMNLDGGGFVELVKLSCNSSPASLSIVGSSIYWLQGSSTKSVLRANLADGSQATTILATSVFGIPGVAVYVPAGQSQPVLVWAETDSGMKIKQTGLETLSGTTVATATGPNGLELIGDTLYWPDQQATAISAVNRDGSNRRNIVSGTVTSLNPYDVDVQGDLMYWTEQDAGRIKRANIDGTGTTTLLSGLNSPYAVDVTSGYIYWASFFQRKIVRANLDGNGNVVSGTTIDLITTISVRDFEVTDSHIFFTNAVDGFRVSTISRVKLDGTENVELVTGLDFPNGIDIAGQFIYWAEMQTGKIHRAKLDGSEVVEMVVGLSSPRGVAVFLDTPRPPQITEHPVSRTVMAIPDDFSKGAIVDRTVTFTRTAGAATFPPSGSYTIALHADGNTYALSLAGASTVVHSGVFLYQRDDRPTSLFSGIITALGFFPDGAEARFALRANNTYELRDRLDLVVQSGGYAINPVTQEPVTFSVVATGDPPLTYQWKFKATSAPNFIDVPGANGSSLAIPQVRLDDAGDYKVVVANGVTPDAESQIATLTVNAAPITYLLLATAEGRGQVGPATSFSQDPVLLTATPANPNRYEFARWEGDGANEIVTIDAGTAKNATLTMDRDRRVTAVFRVKVDPAWIATHFPGIANPDLDDPDLGDDDDFTPREEYILGTDPNGLAPASATVAVTAGWNLISLPVQPAMSQTIRSVLSTVTVLQDWWIDGWMQRANRGGQAVCKRGYWVYLPHDTVPGSRPVTGMAVDDASVFLDAGWNLVGFTAGRVNPRAESNSNIRGPIWYWDADRHRFEPAPDTEPLSPGRGYWINVAADTEL